MSDQSLDFLWGSRKRGGLPGRPVVVLLTEDHVKRYSNSLSKEERFKLMTVVILLQVRFCVKQKERETYFKGFFGSDGCAGIGFRVHESRLSE